LKTDRQCGADLSDPTDPTDRSDPSATLAALLAEVRACRQCEPDLPLGPRPVLRASVTSRLLIVGQAPGTRVHETGIPWNDPSGERLRDWMQLDRERFYDDSKVAIIPMGYCYPGRHPRGGDKPPRCECAQIWLPRLLACLPNIRLTLLVGSYAQRHYLGDRAKDSLTKRSVRGANICLPTCRCRTPRSETFTG